MHINPTPEQNDFIRLAIESGRIPRAEDAVQQALALWVERERRRLEILAVVTKAETSIAQGKGRVITQESMQDLAKEVHQRGIARLAQEQTPR